MSVFSSSTGRGSTLGRRFPSMSIDGGTSDRKILVAVDFGTTFSGLAWAQTRRPDRQYVVTQWPDATSQGFEGISSDKVPTEIKYNQNGSRDYKWGFEISDEGPRYQWFKLELDPSQIRGSSELARRFPARNALPPGYNINAETLVTDYLRALRQHTENFLKHKLGEVVLRSTITEYIITTPAVWSDAAQATTRACAQKAGMGQGDRLQIVSEPEAAATYALDALDPHGIKIGDTFVLCDAGGGTVDLISYTVSALKPILKLDEAAPGTGGLCGSTYLNRIFQQFLLAKFGANPGWDDEVVEEAMNRFELVTKRAFAGNPDEIFSIPVPGLVDDASQGVRRGKFSLSGAEVTQIYLPVLHEITALVKGQISETKRDVKAVLMVGGFGQNGYLRESLRIALGSSTEIIQSPSAWTAVVRGALIKGLAGQSVALERVRIDSSSARKNYGSEASQPWDDEKWKRFYEYRYWDSFSGCHVIKAMEWYIKKGDPVKEDSPVSFPYFTVRRVEEGPPSTIDSAIRVCEDPRNQGAPLRRNSKVDDLVKLKADLSYIPESSIDKRYGKDGKQYYYVEWAIEMTNYSASTKYEIEYKGVRYATVTAEYV